MTRIGTAVMSVDIGPIASPAKATAQPQSSSDAGLFAEMLENAGFPEKRSGPSEAIEMPLVRRVELSLGGRSELQAATDLDDDQQAAPLLEQVGGAEASGIPEVAAMPSGVPVTTAPTSLLQGLRPDADSSQAVAGVPRAVMAHLTPLDQSAPDQSVPDRAALARTVSVSSLEPGVLADAASHRGAAHAPSPTAVPMPTPRQSPAPTHTSTITPMTAPVPIPTLIPMPTSGPNPATMAPKRRAEHQSAALITSAQPATNASRTSLSSIRHETHLPAAGGLAVAVSQRAPIDENRTTIEGEARSHAPRSVVDSGVDAASLGPSTGDVEPVAVQIAGQVSAAWASLQGALPADSGESTSQMAPANPVHQTAADVVKALRFELHPGDLGEVHVRLSMDRNGLRLHLSFSADRAAGIAQAEGNELMQAISAGGMTLSQLVIDTIGTGRVEPPVRQDASASHVAISWGSMADGGGAGREHHAQQEQARRHQLAERYAAQSSARNEEKTGIFI